ncbi:poly(A)-specific ribonuclease PARN-like [Macrosteles quadrilineatus]|uniref:poly(A)-specific ribonuclease PARN-like n=1 Tax=Macrosteles quadrilineatus TaxID=74068 RepID=UPI0023E31ED5|nr:poly(A)-specific ribonuclease PARN-like [Macrosteles quadrilineatus]
MDVTRDNFRKVLPEIEETINRCVFMAIDGEFTGLSSGLEEALSPFDTPAEYYHKTKANSMDFLFIQFGLVAFMYNKEDKKYTNRAYNFYMFPKPMSRQAPDCRFMCQTSSIDFLASHGFDFNKLFRQGIPYLNKRDETAMRTKLEEVREKRKSFSVDRNNSFVECPPEHRDEVKNAVNLIVDFLSTKQGGQELVLPQTTAFIRKLVYQEIHKRYSTDEMHVETKNGVMVVKHPLTEEQKAEEEKKKMEEEEASIDDAVGFSTVIKLISQSRKLIVGHNMLLDLCHMIHRFCEPLPDSYLEFKEILHSVFPYILDTKFMCATRPLCDKVPSSVLSHLLTTVSEPPFTLLTVEPEGEHAYSRLDQKEHEAGFDAYITGTIAIALSNYLARHKKNKSDMKLPSADAPHLKDVINRLFMMKVSDCFIDLERDDPEPKRDAVFHVTFPEQWKLTDLSNLFSPYGGVYVSWINSRSAYCSLSDKSQALKVLNSLAPAAPAGVTVRSYYAHHNLLQASSPATGSRRKLSAELTIKRPSVDPIPEEVEDKGTPVGTHLKRKRKLSENKNDTKKIFETAVASESKNTTGAHKKLKLFEESLDWG